MIRSSPRGECLMPSRMPVPPALEAEILLVENRVPCGLVGNRLSVRRRQVQQRPGTAVVSDPAHDGGARRRIEIVEDVPCEDCIETDVVLLREQALDDSFNVAFLLRHGHFGIVGQPSRYVPDVEHAGEL